MSRRDVNRGFAVGGLLIPPGHSPMPALGMSEHLNVRDLPAEAPLPDPKLKFIPKLFPTCKPLNEYNCHEKADTIFTCSRRRADTEPRGRRSDYRQFGHYDQHHMDDLR